MLKNRTAVAAGIIALVLFVGGLALYNNQQANKLPEAAMNPSDEPTTSASTTPADPEESDKPAAGDNNETSGKGSSTDGKTDTKPNDKSNDKSSDKTSSGATTTVPATHTVVRGDTLRDIAQRYYGNAVYSGDIERMNELPDPNNIPVGKVLKLPRPDELNNAPATAPKADSTGEGTDDTPIH